MNLQLAVSILASISSFVLQVAAISFAGRPTMKEQLRLTQLQASLLAKRGGIQASSQQPKH